MKSLKEAQLYTSLGNKQVDCFLCSHGCRIQEGKFGFCGVRQNIRGVLYTHNYGKLVAANVDPVEKKPLYHFFPGSSTFSIASAGCNFRCGFCQNWEISQLGFAYRKANHCSLTYGFGNRRPNHGSPTSGFGNRRPNHGSPTSDFVNRHPGEDFSADKVVQSAQQNNCRSIAYTYTEPTIYFEFALETAKLAKAAGLRNIFVTNGYMSRQAISLLSPYLDAANIDLKFFKDSSYQKICSARLTPVLDSIRLLKAAGVWIEVTTLVIPGENDTRDELSGIAEFIAGVNKKIPWHISRFHAQYKFYRYPDTPENTLKMAYGLGKASGLDHVYAGNVYGWGQDTLCPACKKALIKREGFKIAELHLLGNKCVFCQADLAGIFNPP